MSTRAPTTSAPAVAPAALTSPATSTSTISPRSPSPAFPTGRIGRSLPWDVIHVRDLVVRNRVGVDSWERSKPQPLHISVAAYTDIDAAGALDSLTSSIHYGTMTTLVTEFGERHAFKSMEALAVGLARMLIDTFGGAKGLRQVAITVEKPRALLHAACTGVHIVRTEADFAADGAPAAPRADHQDRIYIRDLSLSAIIGVNPWEREEKQLVVLNLDLVPPTSISNADTVPRAYNYRLVANLVQDYVEKTSFKTIEALCHHVARHCLDRCSMHQLTIKIEKPSAIVFAKSSAVEVTRDLAWLNAIKAHERAASTTATFQRTRRSSLLVPPPTASNVAYIALGSNLGDRAGHIHRALDEMVARCGAVIADTSFLYETEPMYVTDQPRFLNAACKIYTPLAPIELLDKLKEIEAELGRTDTGRNGPRPIDLDILLYNQVEMKTEKLEIPHPRIQEREFVLRPLADIAANVEHPTQFRTVAKLLALLQHTQPQAEPMHRVLPLSRDVVWTWGRKTYIMGILNVTPDSFSDGGKYTTLDAALSQAQAMVAAGADILDIGGQSTRPGAEDIGEAEEIRRVVPVIQHLRNHLPPTVPISIDTFRAKVAAAALDAGANLVNDVTGGHGDPAMRALWAARYAPVCIMHMRGTPSTMQSKTGYAEVGGIVRGVAVELGTRIDAALAAGVPRWNIVADPGIGFAKAGDQNFELLAHLKDVAAPRVPLLVGPSRKRFIGEVIGQPEAARRTWGTAAAIAACVAGGADIVRVHDVGEMRDVVRVADQVWRRPAVGVVGEAEGTK
ncbi:trifunctional dihydropteroate synthetase [Allomyces javanicus]|nr:trifunctional dihydropteroate synthetase [Allomyces javanicus]